MEPFDKEFGREKLLQSQYGQFDLIEYFFPSEQILISKPRVLMQQINKYFDLPEGTINPTVFRAWLRRYKIRYNSAKTKETLLEAEEETVSENNEWKNFRLSDSSDIQLKETIIKVIKDNK
ncbi:MAG TPA: hypothetical protein VFQ86_02920 [Arachidicoccus soli]|uniref:Uncharacterized protein n=1 Tax=Arachidicoccus soli TaxID=2341117 RepID=A0A386HUE2_9BACT|nr:hypothetical protein [Arachidicoccus soli]AYD49060.1 hypothetical protein D6B99_16415 [Arachidicoccus soli]HEU0226664.1 hypothetical protein [Arachidicoccus soli]